MENVLFIVEIVAQQNSSVFAKQTLRDNGVKVREKEEKKGKNEERNEEEGEANRLMLGLEKWLLTSHTSVVSFLGEGTAKSSILCSNSGHMCNLCQWFTPFGSCRSSKIN